MPLTEISDFHVKVKGMIRETGHLYSWSAFMLGLVNISEGAEFVCQC